MRRSIPGLFRSDSGAVAPTVALSLFGLIAVGGIAFDYARVASMDTELQNAADQAALAAAGQLDQQTDACARAAAAASALLVNETLFANDSGGLAVAIANESACDATGSIQFYQSYDQVTDTPGTAATSDANARVVIVSVNPRESFFALTPIVAAVRSGAIGAQAVATLASSLCKVPPVMICNPQETPGNTTFNVADYVGDGIRLTTVGNGSGTWAPGNFGYLNSGGGSGGAQGLKEALGWNSPPGNCSASSGVETKPGASVSVTDAMNTRFDMYDSSSCPTPGACTASVNSVKDVKRPANASGGNSCRPHNQGWQLPALNYYGQALPILPVPLTPLLADTLTAMGHPRDMCHAVSSDGVCTDGRIGDGLWDADAYFRVNYVRTVAGSGGAAGERWDSADWQANTGLSPTAPRMIPGPNPGDPPVPNPAYASRYNVYAWEIANRNALVDGVNVLDPHPNGASGSTLVAYGESVCSASEGYGPGQVPSATVLDRRRITSAVVNCTANNVNGNSTNVPVEKWISFFIVEPSLARDRTHQGDIYVEVVGETAAGSEQIVRHDVPFLIK